MAIREDRICDPYLAPVPELTYCEDRSVITFRVTDPIVELCGVIDVARLAEMVIDQTHVLLDKLERGERLADTAFVDFSVCKGADWEVVRNRALLSAFVEERIADALNKELNFALDRTANISNRLVKEAVFIVGLDLEARGVLKIIEGGIHLCKQFARSFSDKEAEAMAETCAASPSGWTQAKIKDLKQLKEKYKYVVRQARKAYSRTHWREQRRDLLLGYPEMAEVVDKIPVKEHFHVADLAFEVAAKRLSLKVSSYMKKKSYGSVDTDSYPAPDCSGGIASAVAAAFQKLRTKVLSTLS